MNTQTVEQPRLHPAPDFNATLRPATREQCGVCRETFPAAALVAFPVRASLGKVCPKCHRGATSLVQRYEAAEARQRGEFNRQLPQMILDLQAAGGEPTDDFFFRGI